MPARRAPAVVAVRRGRFVLPLLALLLAACRQPPPTVPPQATPVGVTVLPQRSAVPPAPFPAAIATWTPAAGPPGATAPAPAFVPPLGDIPVPTPRPRLTVPAAGPPLTDPEIVRLMGRVSGARLSADVRRLAGFGTRHALSAADDPRRGIGAARLWLATELDRLNGRSGRQVLVEHEDFPLELAGRSTTQRNVIATLPGIGLNKRLIYVTAHYDSRGDDPADGQADAPGADDNASGTAALLELARVLSSRSWDGTIRLLGLASHETGAQGSAHHASRARQVGMPIIAVLNADTIGAGAAPGGGAGAAGVRLLSAEPPDSASRQLARTVQVIAERYAGPAVQVMPQADAGAEVGDHRPFSDAGFPSVELTAAGAAGGRRHRAHDTPDGLDAAAHAAAVRLLVAVVANLALAPPAPAAAPRWEPAADRPGAVQITWEPVATDDHLAGYWIGVRAAGEAAYRPLVWAGKDPTFVLGNLPAGEELAIAVAAADDLGHLSLFSPELAIDRGAPE